MVNSIGGSERLVIARHLGRARILVDLLRESSPVAGTGLARSLGTVAGELEKAAGALVARSAREVSHGN